MAKSEKTYPISVSLALICTAVILSFVDLMFLNEVIGKVLNIGSIESLFIAFTLGLVGLAIMAHQGVKEAYGNEKKLFAFGHYLIWISLGLTFAAIRLFSATILGSESLSSEESLFSAFGLDIRQIDLILAPLMLFLYIATGLMVKDGVKNMILNPKYEEWMKERAAAKKLSKVEKMRLAEETKARIAKEKADAKKEQERRAKEIEEERKANKKSDANNRVLNIRNASYADAVTQYRAKENEIKAKYQQISANISFIEDIDKREDEFESKIKPSLLQIVRGSIRSSQNNVALIMHNKTGEDITKLKDVIKAHTIRSQSNNQREEN